MLVLQNVTRVIHKNNNLFYNKNNIRGLGHMRAASISVLPVQNYGNVRQSRHYQQSAWGTSFLGNTSAAGRDVFVKTQTNYFKAKPVSFKGSYDRAGAESLIDRINSNQVSANGKGFQSEYFKLNEQFGLKAPNPKDLGPMADIAGNNNIKEYQILKRIQVINPEIAVRPVDLIHKHNKHYLVLEHLEGKHPFETKLTPQHLADITDKTFSMDIHGVVHSDLQSGNIIISNDGRAKFIDFGSFSILKNNGSYIASEQVDENFIKEGRNIDSPLKDKFRAVFYDNSPVYDVKNYSDNPHLKIKSNASNFEFRTIYDYIKHDRTQEPKTLLVDYLKAKSQNYHAKMVEFLENMEMSPSDTAQVQKKNNALETEKMFKTVFASPNEKVMRTELGKIQLKWLMNDYQGANTGAFDYFNKLVNQTREYAQTSIGAEKTYFETMMQRLDGFKEVLNNEVYKGTVLADKDDIVKKVFDKIEQKTQQVVETAGENPGEKVKRQSFSKAALFNKKNVVVALAVATVAACGVYLNKSLRSKNANMS